MRVEGTAKDVREPQDIVDLVGVVRPPGGDDRVGARRAHLLRGDLGVGIGHREDDRFLRHRAYHRLVDRPFDRKAEEDIGTLDRLSQAARKSVDRMRRLPLVHAVGAAVIDDTPGVTQGDVVRRQPHRL